MANADFTEAPATKWLRGVLTGSQEPARYSQSKSETEQLKALEQPDTGDTAPAGMPSPVPLTPSAPEGTIPGETSPATDAHVGQVRSAISALEQALTSAGSHTQSGQVILQALRALGKHFGEQQQPAINPALTNMVRNQNQTGGTP